MTEEFIGPCSRKQEMYVKSEADVTIFGGAAGCYDADTEYLSPSGWVKFSEFKSGQVGQYDPLTNNVSFVTPQEYVKLPCSSFKRMSARGIDMCLSPEHRVPYWTFKDDSQPKVITFEEVVKRHEASSNKGWTGNIKTTFNWSGEGLDITEGELRLQVAVQADGRIVQGGKDNYTQMRFSKKRKYDRLISLCKEFNLPYKDNGSTYNPQYSNETQYEVIVWPKFADKVFDSKYLTCSSEQFKIIADEVGHWDGSFVENNSSKTIRYFTKHRTNADFIQLVFHSCGLNTSLVVDKRDGNITVNGSSTGKGFRTFANKDGKCEVENVPSKDGFKYCFTVDSGFLLVRRNDKVFISGNSGKSEIGVIDFLKHVDTPNFIGLITRLTTPQLKGPGGIFAKCKRYFDKTYPGQYYWREKDGKFVFPHSNAEIYLKHYQTEADYENFQGVEANLFLIDEGTQFSVDKVNYIMSRMRNPNCPEVHPHMKITCNPDADHFLRAWVDWYLKDDGRPNPEKDGILRYFAMEDGNFIFADTKEELVERTGQDISKVLSYTFISANVK